MPGVPCGGRGNWDWESLLHRSHACESLEKIKFRAFPKRVGPRILSRLVNFRCIQIGLLMSIPFIFGDD